jgi:protein-tyrosine kinase
MNYSERFLKVEESTERQRQSDSHLPDESRSVLSYNRFPFDEEKSKLVASEALGILRSRLLKVHAKRGIHSVAITSAGPGEGKTLLSVNLAYSFGQLNQARVLLVDGDLRGRGTTHALKLEHLPGLGDLLLGEQTCDAVIHPTEFSRLSVVPAGKIPRNAVPELLESSYWRNFVAYAEEHFDLLLVDSLPASAPVADFELIAAMCDALLVVVQMRKTNRESLKRIQARLDPGKVLGVVINNAAEDSSYHKYDYYPGCAQQ